MPLSESLQSQISQLISDQRVVLFMKGTRRAPQCGFSAQVVRILDEHLPEYQTVDVLSSPELREGIKVFSSWPTIPQLYIAGKFVGGCDIVRELNDSGELRSLLGTKTITAPRVGAAPALPSIRVSAAAQQAFQAAQAECPGDALHLKIDADFEHDLFFGPPEPGELELSVGSLLFRIDPASAPRAAGLSIDFVDGETRGFKLDNPNQPPRVTQLSAAELKAKLDRGEIQVFDVRPDAERALASIAQARPLDEEGQRHLLALPRSTPIAPLCHHGVRSQNAAQELLREGFRNVYNLQGGIDAWSQSVDSSVPRY